MGKKSSKLKDWLIFGGIGMGLGVGMVRGLTDGIGLYYKHKNGLELLDTNVHLKEGVHDVVITNQFYNLLKYEDLQTETKNLQAIKDSEETIIEGMKKAYEDLNEVNKGIQFNLCAETDELASYGIQKKDNIDKKNDLLLYLTADKMKSSNGKLTLAETNTNWDIFTRELKNESITFRRDYMSVRWGVFEEIQNKEEPDLRKSYSYILTLHETMHAMGFAHQKNEDSIMCASITSTSPRALTQKDIAMIKKYNEVFYKSKYETPDFTNKTITTDEMTM